MKLLFLMSLVVLLCIANLPTSEAGAWFLNLFRWGKPTKEMTTETSDGMESTKETSPETPDEKEKPKETNSATTGLRSRYYQCYNTFLPSTEKIFYSSLFHSSNSEENGNLPRSVLHEFVHPPKKTPPTTGEKPSPPKKTPPTTGEKPRRPNGNPPKTGGPLRKPQ
ncbi:unnamed protein product [Trichobilharzia szidati]|nr:unnamed protein product [Trichobilharzia szidati]